LVPNPPNSADPNRVPVQYPRITVVEPSLLNWYVLYLEQVDTMEES